VTISGASTEKATRRCLWLATRHNEVLPSSEPLPSYSRSNPARNVASALGSRQPAPQPSIEQDSGNDPLGPDPEPALLAPSLSTSSVLPSQGPAKERQGGGPTSTATVHGATVGSNE
jgi:hypothetical protein